MSESALHTPVGTTLAIAFIMLSPERPISFQQAHSVMECCGLMEGPHEWCLTLSTTSRVPKPVYEALLGTLYSDLVFKEGSEWKFGTGTRNKEFFFQVGVNFFEVGVWYCGQQ